MTGLLQSNLSLLMGAGEMLGAGENEKGSGS